MIQKIHDRFWAHFNPMRKRHLFIRKLRFVDGWFTYMESISPHAYELQRRAFTAVYENHPPSPRQAEMREAARMARLAMDDDGSGL